MPSSRLRAARSEFPYKLDNPFTRVTAFALYYRPLGPNRIWATTFAFGTNQGREIVSGGILDALTGGALLESSLTFTPRQTIFGRGEIGWIPGPHLHATEYPRSVFTVGKLQVG